MNRTAVIVRFPASLALVPIARVDFGHPRAESL
jgi:hypothetical protein